MNKKWLIGILALSLTCGTGLADAAKGGNSGKSSSSSSSSSGSYSSSSSSSKKEVRQESKKGKADVDTNKVMEQAAAPLTDKVTQETKDQMKARVKESLKNKQPEEIKAELEGKVQKLSKEFRVGKRETYTELGQYYEAIGDRSLKTFVNGETPEMDVQPFIQRGRAMVPVRAIVAALKADVDWDPETETVTVTRGETVIQLQIGSSTYTVNGEEGTLDVAATLKQGRTFLPFRAISELLGAKVDYEENGNIIIVEDEAAAELEQEGEVETPEAPEATESVESTESTETPEVTEPAESTETTQVNQEEQAPASTESTPVTAG